VRHSFPARGSSDLDALLFLCCIRGPAWLEVPIAQPRSPDKAEGRIRGPATLEISITQPGGNAQRVATRQPRSPDKAKGRIRGPATLEISITQPGGNAQRVAPRQPRSPDKAEGRIRGPATLEISITQPSGNTHAWLRASRVARIRPKAASGALPRWKCPLRNPAVTPNAWRRARPRQYQVPAGHRERHPGAQATHPPHALCFRDHRPDKAEPHPGESTLLPAPPRSDT